VGDERDQERAGYGREKERTSSFSVPDPARRPPVFIFVHTDEGLGIAYSLMD